MWHAVFMMRGFVRWYVFSCNVSWHGPSSHLSSLIVCPSYRDLSKLHAFTMNDDMLGEASQLPVVTVEQAAEPRRVFFYSFFYNLKVLLEVLSFFTSRSRTQSKQCFIHCLLKSTSATSISLNNFWNVSRGRQMQTDDKTLSKTSWSSDTNFRCLQLSRRDPHRNRMVQTPQSSESNSKDLMYDMSYFHWFMRTYSASNSI